MPDDHAISSTSRQPERLLEITETDEFPTWADLLDHLCDPHGHAQDRWVIQNCEGTDTRRRRQTALVIHRRLHSESEQVKP